MSFFISDAFAQAAPAAPAGGNSMSSILMLLGFVVILYFLLLRPQAKRAKEHRNLISNLGIGDEVLTSGGLYGKITKLADDFVVVAISDNVEVRVQKNAVINVLPKGTLKTGS